ncbi:MAG: LTA synthase family protein [Lachnospiraceae bacterium]
MKDKLFKIVLPYFFLIATPAFCYVIFEWITGNLSEIRGEYIVWNILFYYTAYVLFLVITNHMRTAYLSLNVIFTIWAAAEYFVSDFRARPIMPSDILAWQTAATVADNYSYVMPQKMIQAVLLMLAWSIGVWMFRVKLPRGKKRLPVLAAGLAWTIGWISCFFTVVVPARSIGVSMWDPIESYEQNGYLLSTVRMLGYLHAKLPEGYHSDTVRQMYQELEGQEAAGESPVNIICIMNESWSDLNIISEFQTDQPSFAYYNSLDENCIKGYVYVPVFGSMTSNSEYEFLTGNSMAFVPIGSVPFQLYMKDHTWSIVDSVKDEGYETIAMHPYPAGNWNRIEAFNSLGFDQFLDEEYFLDSPRIRGYVSDQGCYEKIIQMTEEDDGQTRQFFFLVTMQNHGGYTLDYESQVHLTEYENYPEAEQYLSLIRESDNALEYLIEYYKDSDQPTLIMMFGDHQPGIETQFYEGLYKNNTSATPVESYLQQYATPYLIWTNYDNSLGQQGDYSVLYLANQVLKAANLPLNGYQSFLEELKEQVPIIHLIGYCDKNGLWSDWTDWRESESYGWFHLLDLYQYYRVFDPKRLK